MKDLILGDLTIVDSGDIGIDIHNRMKNKKVCWINAKGCEALKNWLIEKKEDKEKEEEIMKEPKKKGEKK